MLRSVAEFMYDTMVASLLSTNPIVGSRIDELTKQLESTGETVESLTAKLSDIKDAREKIKRENGSLVMMTRTETERSKNDIFVQRDGALSRYKSVLQYVLGIVEEEEELNASYTDTSAQLLLLLQE